MRGDHRQAGHQDQTGTDTDIATSALTRRAFMRVIGAGAAVSTVGLLLSACSSTPAAPSAAPTTASGAAGSGAAAPPTTTAASAAANAAPSVTSGQTALAALVQKAAQEGELDTATITEVGPAVPKMIDAFNKRFGLNLTINVALGDQAGKYVELFTQLQSGLQPTYDTLTGTEEDNNRLIDSDWGIKVDNWQEILSEINPRVGNGEVKAEVVSPTPFDALGFLWTTRDKSLLYNTNLISEADLPQTYPDLADPKYKGKFPLAPWTDQWEAGTLVYTDKQDWLNTINKIGQNSAGIIDFSPALDRILLGEFAFQPSNTYYYWQVKAKDATAPIGQAYFKDFIPQNKVLYIIPKGSAHPAAATLWSMWIGTPEAQAIWQPVAFLPNVAFGETSLDKDNEQRMADSGGRVVTFYDDDAARAQLAWFASDDGRAYREQITQALTQRQQ